MDLLIDLMAVIGAWFTITGVVVAVFHLVHGGKR
jgi:hypothetical protein